MVQKTIRVYYAFIVLFQLGISFISAMYVMFLMSHGLDLLQVNLVNFAFATTLMLFEVPTGIVADTFGRKTSFVLSCFTMSLSMLMYGCSSTLGGFIAAEIVGAIGATLATGAFQAWFVDRMRFFGYEGELDHFFAKEQLCKQIAVIAGAVTGAYTADIDMIIPWFLGSIVFTGTGIAAYVIMKEEYFTRNPFSLKGSLQVMRKTLQTSVTYGLKSRVVRFVLLMGFAQYITLQAPNMQWQPFFSQYVGSQTKLGFIFTGISVSIGLGALVSKRIRKRIRDLPTLLVIAQCVIAVGVICTVLVTRLPLIFLFFFGHEIARGVYRPLKDAYLNSNIPSSERATLLSFDSMMMHAGGMAGLLLSGYLAESQSIEVAWVTSGAVLFIVTILIAFKR